MPRLHVRPFDDGDLDAAAALLAERHRTHRLVEPALDERYETVDGARAEIAELRARDAAAAVVAVGPDGALHGYLTGWSRNPALWGPNAWVEAGGHAARDGETLRELYAALAEDWVAAGRTGHNVLVPAHDGVLLDAWSSLSFGRQHVHASRPAPDASFEAAIPDGITIRRAVEADNPALAALGTVVPAHHARSPVFSRAPVPTVEAALAELEQDPLVGDRRFATFVAERDGVVIGSAVGCAIDESSEHAGLARPPGAGFLGYAAVLPEARGTGAGRALGETVLAWARDAGHATVVTDWRSTNIESNRAWLALGFRPYFYRLYRAIG